MTHTISDKTLNDLIEHIDNQTVYGQGSLEKLMQWDNDPTLTLTEEQKTRIENKLREHGML